MKDNIIMMYPSGPVIMVGEVCIALLVLLSVPLQVHPCRISLDKIIDAALRKKGSSSPTMAKHIIMTTLIVLASWGVAVSVKDLSTILGFVGATGSTTICYILPVCYGIVFIH